jgi:hypothetical protein
VPKGTLADPLPRDSTACMAMLRVIVAVISGSLSEIAISRQLPSVQSNLFKIDQIP